MRALRREMRCDACATCRCAAEGCSAPCLGPTPPSPPAWEVPDADRELGA